MPAVGTPLLEQHTFGTGGVHGHVGQYGERAAADFGGSTDADISAVRVIDIGVTFAHQVRPRPPQRFKDVQVRERQAVVFGGLGKPQRLEFFEFVGLFGGQVMALAAVGVDVEQFPAVGIEMRPAGR